MIPSSSNAVLVYHRIASHPLDINLLNVSVDNFNSHLEELKLTREVIPLDDLIFQLKNGIAKPNSIAITFDDGYYDFIDNAIPVLLKHKTPATLFTTTGIKTKDNFSFWWDRIEDILISKNSKLISELIKSKNKLKIEQIIKLQKELISLPAAAINQFLNSKFTKNTSHKYNIATLEELSIAVADSDIIKIGSHSISHSMLSILSQKEQEIELSQSRNILEKMFKDKFCNYFSIPFGHPGSWNNDTINISKSIGYSGILSTQQNLIKNKKVSFVIPRLLVRDWSKNEFKNWLEQGYSLCHLDNALKNRDKKFKNYFSS